MGCAITCASGGGRHKIKMNVLFLSRWFPYPPDNGAKIRVYNLLRELANQCTIDLIAFTSEPVSEERITPLKQFCREIDTVLYRPFEQYRWKAMLGFFSPLPRSVLDTDNPQMHAAVQRALQNHSYDLVIASQVDLAQYARHIPGPKILEEIELASLYEQVKTEQNPLNKVRHRLMWRKWVRYVAATMRTFNGCTVVSEPERKLVEGLLHQSGCIKPVKVIANGVDLRRYQENFGAPEPGTMIFSGALTYQANYDAMEFFLSEIYPLIQAKCPNAKLSISGRLNGVPVERLPKPSRVVYTDYLEDIRPTIAQSWVSIVPLHIGGGTRLKILEALALGTPVVSTSKGAEGLELTPNQDILIADTPSEFASAVLRLFADPILRQTLSQNGKQAVAARYDWQMIGQTLNEFINQILKNDSR